MSENHGRGRMLLAAVALSTGVLMVVEGCAPQSAVKPLAPAATLPTLATHKEPPQASKGNVEASKPTSQPASEAKVVAVVAPPAAPAPKPVAVAKATSKPECIKVVKKRVGNGKGAQYTVTKIDVCKGKSLSS